MSFVSHVAVNEIPTVLRFSISCNVFQICPLPTGTVITVVYSPFLSLCLVLGDKVAMYITVTITEGT